MDEAYNSITDMALHMHDSFQTINDRLKKIETKVNNYISNFKNVIFLVDPTFNK